MKLPIHAIDVIFTKCRSLLKAFALLAVFISLNCQTSYADDIKSRKKELKDLSKEISQLENEIKAASRDEKRSIGIIENYNRQSFLLNKLIQGLKTEEGEKEARIARTEQEITEIEKRMKSLRKSYSKYVVYLYKYGKNNLLKMLLGSGNLNQALIRYKYLRKITSQRERDLDELKRIKGRLGILRGTLVTERDEKRQLGQQKQIEESQLIRKISERKAALQEIRNDKDALRKELDLKKQAQVQISGIIDRLVAEDQKRRAEEKARREQARLEAKRKQQAEEKRKREEALRLAEAKNKANSKKTSAGGGRNKPDVSKNSETVASERGDGRFGKDENTSYSGSAVPADDLSDESLEMENEYSSGAFSSLKGRLSWPMNGSIIRKYGENRNQKLNTVTVNYGIDISSGSDLSVRSVAEGTISSINWLPGYGSVVIVTHAGGYRTVYGHLEQIYQSKGSRVAAGAVIGKVGESIEGNVLHFEVWSERQNLNPEVWLR